MCVPRRRLRGDARTTLEARSRPRGTRSYLVFEQSFDLFRGDRGEMAGNVENCPAIDALDRDSVKDAPADQLGSRFPERHVILLGEFLHGLGGIIVQGKCGPHAFMMSRVAD